MVKVTRVLLLIILVGCISQLHCGFRLHKKSLVFITIDGLSSEVLETSKDGHPVMPFLNKMRQNALISCTIVPASVSQYPQYVSMFTGKYPVETGVRFDWINRMSSEQQTLTMSLKQRFYNTGAFLNNPFLTGSVELSNGFDVYDDRITVIRDNQPDVRETADVAENLIKWLDSEHKPPFYAWIAMFDMYRLKLDAWKNRGIVPDEYFHAATEVDRAVERVFNYINSKPFAKNTLFCIVGSGGILRDNDLFLRIDHSMEPSLTELPLIIYQSRPISGRLRPEMVFSSVDIPATLLGLLDIPNTDSGSGVDILKSLKSKEIIQNRIIYSENLVPQLMFGWPPVFMARKRHETVVSGYGDSGDDAMPGETVVEIEGSGLQEQMNEFFSISDGFYVPLRYDIELTNAKLSMISSTGNLLGELPIEKGTRNPAKQERDRIIGDFLHMLESVAAGQYDMAIQQGKDLLAKDPANLATAYILIGAYDEMNRLEDSVAFLKTMNTYYPQLPGLIFKTVETFILQRNPDEAMDYLNNIIDKSNRMVFTAYHKARILGMKYRHDDIIRFLESVSAQRGLVDEELVVLGDAYMESGNAEEAEKTYGLAMRLNEWNHEAVFKRGLVHFQQKNYRNAAAYFENAVNLDPTNVMYAHFLAKSFIYSGIADKAIPILQTLIRNEPEQLEMQFDLLKAALATGNEVLAEKQCAYLIKREPRVVKPLILMVNYYIDMNDSGQAMEKYRLAEEIISKYRMTGEKDTLEALHKQLKDKGFMK